MMAHSTLFGMPNLPNNVGFLLIEGQRLQSIVGRWFGILFWGIGAFSLFAVAMGIVDYASRLAADVIKSTYLRESKLSESRIYFRLVWGMVALGITILMAGFDQPLVLLLISACSGGATMFLYSFLLILLNRRALPAGHRRAIVPAGSAGVVDRLFWRPLRAYNLAAAFETCSGDTCPNCSSPVWWPPPPSRACLRRRRSLLTP